MQEINFNYLFDVTIESNSILANEGILILKIPIKGYLPGEQDHISYNDYLIIQRNILAVVQPLLSGELILCDIRQRPKKYIEFKREHFSLFCKLEIKNMKKNFYETNLEFTKGNIVTFIVDETLIIK